MINIDKKTKEIIHEILLRNEGARNNTFIVYFEYLNVLKLNDNEVSKKLKNTSIKEILIYPYKLGIASVKTVERLVRKLQELDRKEGKYLIQNTNQVRKNKAKLEQEYRKIFKK